MRTARNFIWYVYFLNLMPLRALAILVLFSQGGWLVELKLNLENGLGWLQFSYTVKSELSFGAVARSLAQNLF